MIRSLVFAIVVFGSCNSPKKIELKDTLRSNCFWDITGDKEVIGGLNSCFRFLSNGKCYFYYYNFYNKKITDSVYKYDFGDVMVSNTWSTEGDTILVANDISYRVLSFTEDTVVIGQKHDTVTLIKNCKTHLSN